MKNYLLALQYFFLCALANAQSFNVAEHNGATRTFNMVGINNKSYYLEVSTPMQYCCYDEVHLIGRDSNGHQSMNLVIGAYGYMNYARVTVSDKRTLLVYAGTIWGECDLAIIKFFVSEIDTLGNLLWSSTLNQKVEVLLPLPSGSRIMLTSNSMIRLNANGQTLSTYTTNYGNSLNSACVLNNSHILLSNNNALVEIDTLGNLINTTTLATSFELTQVATGNIYGILSGNIVKLSATSYSVLATSSFSNFSATTYCYKNDSIFVCGNEGNLIPKYVLLDTALNILHQSSSNLEQVQCTGITVDNSKTVKILSCGSSVAVYMDYPPATSHFFSSYFHTSASGNLNGTQDIGVIDMKIDSAHYVPNTYPGNLWLVKGRAIVKNFGSQTIQRFRLNHYALVTGISYCIVGLNQYCDITLLPGETTTVVTNKFNCFSYPNVCLFTTVPDSTNDYDMSNNQICITSTVNVTGIQEYSQEIELNIFPNPSNGLVNIHAEKTINKIEILDYSGKQVGIYFPNTQNFELKKNSLVSGLYIFKITTANYTALRKVIIE